MSQSYKQYKILLISTFVRSNEECKVSMVDGTWERKILSVRQMHATFILHTTHKLDKGVTE